MRRCIGLCACLVGCAAFAAESAEMWNCAVGNTPGNAVVLVSGPRSYVKISNQRAPASFTRTEDTRRWVWGNNSIVIDDQGIGHYYEGANTQTPTGRFRCRQMR